MVLIFHFHDFISFHFFVKLSVFSMAIDDAGFLSYESPVHVLFFPLFWIFSMIGQLPWLLHLEHFISKLLLLCLTLNIGWLVGKQGNQKLAYIKPQGAPETTLSSYFAGYWIQPSIPTHVSAPGRGVPYVVLNPRQWMSFGLVTIFLCGCASMLVIILVFVFLCSFFLDF